MANTEFRIGFEDLGINPLLKFGYEVFKIIEERKNTRKREEEIRQMKEEIRQIKNELIEKGWNLENAEQAYFYDNITEEQYEYLKKILSINV